jgi:hypothetical protein
MTMAITLEAPIEAGDIRVLKDQGAVALNVEKFGELVNYIEHLEGTLKYADIEFRQERRFAQFLKEALDELIHKVESIGQGHVCSEMAYSWGDQINHLYLEGEIGRESADEGQDIVSKLTGKAAKVADAERGVSC